MNNFSPVASRIVAVALLVAIIAAAWGLVMRPIAAQLQAHEQSITDSREQLQRYRRIASTREQWESRLEALTQARSVSGQFLAGESVDLVAADLQSKIKQTISAVGGLLKSMQTLPVKDLDDFDNLRKVALRVDLVADIASLQRIMYRLESSKPYLFVDNTNVRSRGKRTRQGKSGDAKELQIRFDVYGYLRMDAS